MAEAMARAMARSTGRLGDFDPAGDVDEDILAAGEARRASLIRR